ncbi:hypothetical protein [Vitreoscilla sp. C1]|uniref:hypothetical protein n=1 Tax=Vitreoscilla sp. (strain C1) TaxID=96942 RepID=UPI001319D9B7|nr:hypothetical protein [Vitreoscilla sp. C1]
MLGHSRRQAIMGGFGLPATDAHRRMVKQWAKKNPQAILWAGFGWGFRSVP